MRSPFPLAARGSRLALLLSVAAAAPLSAQHDVDASARPEAAVELGEVAWIRDFDAGFARAREDDLPVFLFFQEIPGCSTCIDFGNGPLSHPLVVEAIETEFVPILVFNNKPEDARRLQEFGEPSWNNPVFRFFRPDGEELLRRKDRIWTVEGVARRMVEALEAAEREVPAYLRLALEEHASAEKETAVFAMHCYWEGEAKLGALSGVLATESAWLEQKEVVNVVFDPARISYERLLARALEMDCASTVYATSAPQLAVARSSASEAKEQPGATKRAKDSDQLYYLQNSLYAKLRLSPLQEVKVNAALGTGGDPHAWLSPRQREAVAALVLEKELQERLEEQVGLAPAEALRDRRSGSGE